MIRISINIKGIEDLAKLGKEKIREFLDEYLNAMSDEVRLAAQLLAPVRTGTLRKSIQKKKIDFAHYFVGSDVKYAPYVELGTRPHIIRPRRARALRFEVGGEVVFAKWVRHPGFPGRHFFRRAPLEIKIVWRDVAWTIFKKVMGK